MSLYERIEQYRATFLWGGGSEGVYQSNFFCFFIQIYPCFSWEKFSGVFGSPPPHKFHAPVTRTMTLKRLFHFALCSKTYIKGKIQIHRKQWYQKTVISCDLKKLEMFLILPKEYVAVSDICPKQDSIQLGILLLLQFKLLARVLITNTRNCTLVLI